MVDDGRAWIWRSVSVLPRGPFPQVRLSTRRTRPTQARRRMAQCPREKPREGSARPKRQFEMP